MYMPQCRAQAGWRIAVHAAPHRLRSLGFSLGRESLKKERIVRSLMIEFSINLSWMTDIVYNWNQHCFCLLLFLTFILLNVHFLFIGDYRVFSGISGMSERKRNENTEIILFFWRNEIGTRMQLGVRINDCRVVALAWSDIRNQCKS